MIGRSSGTAGAETAGRDVELSGRDVAGFGITGTFATGLVESAIGVAAAAGAPSWTTVADATVTMESRFGTTAAFAGTRCVPTGAAVVSAGCMAAFTAAAPTTPTTVTLSVHAQKRTMARRRRSRASTRALWRQWRQTAIPGRRSWGQSILWRRDIATRGRRATPGRNVRVSRLVIGYPTCPNLALAFRQMNRLRSFATLLLLVLTSACAAQRPASPMMMAAVGGDDAVVVTAFRALLDE